MKAAVLLKLDREAGSDWQRGHKRKWVVVDSCSLVYADEKAQYQHCFWEQF